MFTRLGRFTVRRRRLVLGLTVAYLVVAGVVGTGVFTKLSGGGFNDPDAESTRARDALEDVFDAGEPNVVLLVTARQGTVDDPAVARAGADLTAALAGEPGVAQSVSYWSLGSPPPLRSVDGTKAMVLARVSGEDDEVDEAVTHITETYSRDDAVTTVAVGGAGPVFVEISETIKEDLGRAEAIAIPLTLLLLVFVFGSVVAAALPLAVGTLAVLGTFLTLYVIASITDVSVFSINLTTAMGLGLAIDYSLFMVSRFREELAAGVDPHAAVVHTVQTAGRTVAFSALTVAVSLAALLVFPLYFLRSFAYAGIAVVLIAAVASLVSLPALLAVLGHRVDALRLWRRRPPALGRGFWHGMAMAVMRRPVPVATAVIAVLLLLGAPFLDVTFGLPDDRALPAAADTRQVSDQLRNDFASNESDAFPVVAALAPESPERPGAIAAYATDLSRVPGVSRVDAMTGTYVDGALVAPPGPVSARYANPTATWFNVVPEVEPISPEGEALVGRVRDLPGPFPVAVTGPSAELVDSKAAIFGRLPLAGAIIALTTFVLLFLSFGSVLVPVKAVILNLLSLTATFGAMVWVFQEGHGAGLLDFTPTGILDTTTPILMFCIAFGLSMDYEVFLLSRIKEEHDLSGDNTASVAMGLERTGRIVTAAAALLAVTFLAFATSRISFIKLFGIGLTLAVVMDATLIRATLVPAFMRLAGEANWWAPGPLRRLHDRFGFSESVGPPPVDEPAQPSPVG